MNRVTRKLSLSTALIFLYLTGIVNALDITQVPFTNHMNDIETNSSSLKLESKSEEINLISSSTNINSENETEIFPSLSESRSNIKTVISPIKDSYLNALEHSHLSNDPHEGIVQADIKSIPSKVIRRTNDSPVYRRHNDYGPPNEPTPGEPEKNSRIIYDVSDITTPTQETFRPTPSVSYSLPASQTSNFNNQILYGNRNKYNLPTKINYGILSASYGVPNKKYGSPHVPQQIYGPPHNSYLPATQPQQGHGSSQWSGFALPDIPQLPSLPSFDSLFPFALKLNAFTIAKIILKLVIFKMIVKFIAVLCLLLFIPKLEMKKDDNNEADVDNDEGRRFMTHHFTTEQLNNLTSIVLNSIEMYQSANDVMFNNEEKCTSVGCRMRRFLRSNETWNDYFKLFNDYINEENTFVTLCVFALCNNAHASPTSTDDDKIKDTKSKDPPKDIKEIKSTATASKDVKEAIKNAKDAKKMKKDCANECGAAYDPICAHDPTNSAFKPRTFASQCALDVVNCEMGLKLAMKNKGECDGAGGVRLS
ncbi:hypothetical protein PV325_003434 [Microctonus aethiopoides]|nr:hypothetical protein PV325_003434 [Microctonus aethiopoides]